MKVGKTHWWLIHGHMTCDKWITFRENRMDKFRESEIFHDLGFREGFSRKGWSIDNIVSSIYFTT